MSRPQGSTMTDSRLNSIHLESLRREEFRRARDSLLGAVGEQTRRAEQVVRNPNAPGSNTLLHKFSNRIPAGLDYVIMDKETAYPLKVGINTVGRLSDNDVAIPDPYLSRRHCAILVHATGDCEVHDVASKNGTYVNGRKIDGPTKLTSGDEIRMCDRQYIFLRRADLDEGEVRPSERTLAD
jgi:hypothetical protein